MNDLSDKAFEELGEITAFEAWRECRKRAANREVVAFQEGWEAACQTYPEISSKS